MRLGNTPRGPASRSASACTQHQHQDHQQPARTTRPHDDGSRQRVATPTTIGTHGTPSSSKMLHFRGWLRAHTHVTHTTPHHTTHIDIILTKPPPPPGHQAFLSHSSLHIHICFLTHILYIMLLLDNCTTITHIKLSRTTNRAH
jgi:hypothetical protein